MFDHERLDVYRLSLCFVSWVHELVEPLKGNDRHIRDQLLRSSISIPLNIAEGNGKRPGADRVRFLQIAAGSASECAAALDVLAACRIVEESALMEGRSQLVRILSMLNRLTASVGAVREEPCSYPGLEADCADA